jgi:hypothetical protein
MDIKIMDKDEAERKLRKMLDEIMQKNDIKRDILRNKIKEIIDEFIDDTELAAKEVLGYIDQEVGLYGNGWLDNDQEMLAYLGYEGRAPDDMM